MEFFKKQPIRQKPNSRVSFPSQGQKIRRTRQNLFKDRDVNNNREITYEPGTQISQQQASFPTGGSSYGHRHYRPIVTLTYDGEKNPGELGVIKRYIPDYRALRLRSWQAYAESDIVQAVIESYIDWVIGDGLVPQVKPQEEILQQRGISINENFANEVEMNFKLFLNSRTSVYNQETNLTHKMREAMRNALISGDTLVVLNVDENNNLSVRCYDGEHIFSPILGGEQTAARNRGNKIIHGVEVDESQKHVAYHLWDGKNSKRIPAFDPVTGMRIAWLVYGRKLRYDHVRGVPLIMAVLESIKKLDRYKEAMVGAAEERAKIAFQIIHKQGSTEENPLVDNVASSLPLNRRIDGAANDPIDDGIKLEQKITSTVGKSVFNMPLESELKALDSEIEFSFKDFFEANIMPICAAVGVPYEVVMKKFGNNFSASRASLKMWEHVMKISRSDFSFHFNHQIYQMWLTLADIRGDINAPGLFRSVAIEKDTMLFEAYTKIKFNGPTVPHVDPMKEVKAEREKLGPQGANIPLTTPQEAATNLGGGDIDLIKEGFEKQTEGFEPPAPAPQNEEGGTVMDIVTDEAV